MVKVGNVHQSQNEKTKFVPLNQSFNKLNTDAKQTPPTGSQSKNSCLNSPNPKGIRLTVRKLTEFLSIRNNDPESIV